MFPHNCTIYFKSVDPVSRMETYKRTEVNGVLFEKLEGINITKYGAQSENKVRVIIPDIIIPIKKGDLIIKGIIYEDFTNLADFKSKYQYYVVNSVDPKDFGGLQHIEVGAK